LATQLRDLDPEVSATPRDEKYLQIMETSWKNNFFWEPEAGKSLREKDFEESRV
jgi:hypothetical protein